MDITQLIGLAGIPVLAALIQAVKMAFPFPDRFWPLLSIALGIAYNLALAALLAQPLGVAAVIGLVAGLATSGLYSTAKTYTTG